MKLNILILGITGSLGHTLFIEALSRENYCVYGTTKDNSKLPQNLLNDYKENIYSGFEVTNGQCNKVYSFIEENKIDIVINCIGVTKQQNPELQEDTSYDINAIFPQYLHDISQKLNCKLIHISSDCVFDGKKGCYTELDIPSATDIYGKSKLLGEISNANSITLRTSFIGHELNSEFGLLEWFLSQTHCVNGFSNAYFSGTTSIELSRIILDYIIPNRELSGILHIGSNKINKYDLLNIIKKIYKKDIELKKDTSLIIDRTLNLSKFLSKVDYDLKSWEQLIYELKEHYKIMAKKKFYNLDIKSVYV